MFNTYESFVNDSYNTYIRYIYLYTHDWGLNMTVICLRVKNIIFQKSFFVIFGNLWKEIWASTTLQFLFTSKKSANDVKSSLINTSIIYCSLEAFAANFAAAASSLVASTALKFSSFLACALAMACLLSTYALAFASSFSLLSISFSCSVFPVAARFATFTGLLGLLELPELLRVVLSSLIFPATLSSSLTLYEGKEKSRES